MLASITRERRNQNGTSMARPSFSNHNHASNGKEKCSTRSQGCQVPQKWVGCLTALWTSAIESFCYNISAKFKDPSGSSGTLPVSLIVISTSKFNHQRVFGLKLRHGSFASSTLGQDQASCRPRGNRPISRRLPLYQFQENDHPGLLADANSCRSAPSHLQVPLQQLRPH